MLRLVAAIMMLLHDRREISVTEVFKTLDIPKSTASRLLKDMANAGILEQDPASRRYRAGPAFLPLRYQPAGGLDLVDEAVEALKPVRDRFGHTCFVMGRDGAALILLRTLEGTGPIRVHVTPPFAGGVAFFRSSGLALLARLPDDEIRALYPTSLRSASSHSPTTAKELLARIELVRQQGYSEISDEGFPDVGGIAVAVAPPDQPPVALNMCFVAGLPSLEERRAIAAALLEAGRQLGQRFGDTAWESSSRQTEHKKISSV